MPMHPSERQRPTASRVKGPRHLLGRLHRLDAAERAYAARLLTRLQALRTPVRRAFEQRAQTEEERRWCLSLADRLDRLIAGASSQNAGAWILDVHEALEQARIAGDAVLPGFADPRTWRTTRKRKTDGISETHKDNHT